ncbi:polysaccharide pyruvyl transferase family protein [Ancylobacter sonchi]|uniref:polysaccharide pyruvyl transferase family protein n=1 Tax=Ancylobacter sonchi TaxID=1937790 RepID=UPI001BD3747D|nr:polysaccharide pyruvyl transferase family protein [Ancylobacter sonchi]MBS7536747.1 polysaccharide pyruvyl transferase family protein [Ancylobacter sonchi]
MALNATKKAVVVGPYRVHNFGDDLVGAIIAKRLQQGGYEVSVPRLGQGNADWLGTKYSESYDGLLQSADTIVVGGGGIMSDTSGSKPGASYLNIVARAAIAGQLRGKRILVTSVGAGPWILERSKMLAFGVSLLADKIGVRDQESFDHLASIGVSGSKVVLGADCALLSADYLDFKAKPSGKIGIQFDTAQFSDVGENPNLKAIAGAVKAYAGAHASDIVLISNGKHKSSLAADAPSCENLQYERLQDFLPRLAGLKSIFTSHLHLAITSYSQRIPTFSLYVREKTKRFYDQIGHPERAIDLSVATLEDFERLIAAAEVATWTDEDEATLQTLQGRARSLLAFVK